MSAYISEFDYFGTDAQEFVEIAVPAGTDVSGFSLYFYAGNGFNYLTITNFGPIQNTTAGHDVYLIDASNPQFNSGGDSMGVFYPDDAIALVDDSNTVLQFISWEGNTVTASGGPADGMTSTNVGALATQDGSLQSDDGGNTYYAQSNANPGNIPACFGPGTWIETDRGHVPVEALQPGDRVRTLQHGFQPLLLLRQSPCDQSLTRSATVRIGEGSLGSGIPAKTLVVSEQHCVLVGAQGQMRHAFSDAALCRAKAMTALSGVEEQPPEDGFVWYHLVFRSHQVVRANGCWSESLFLGPQTLWRMRRFDRLAMAKVLGVAEHSLPTAHRPAFPVLKVAEARQRLVAAELAVFEG